MTLRTSLGMVVALVVATAAQSASSAVWIVDQAGGPGTQFTEIAGAVSVAVDGDTILVREGLYSKFTIKTKALELVAEAGDDVRVAGGIAIRSLTSDQTVVMRGIDTDPPLASGDREEGLLVLQCAGSVLIEDGTFRGGWKETPQSGSSGAEGVAYSGARIHESPRVVLTRCTLVGDDGWLVYSSSGQGLFCVDGGDGLRATASEVSVYDCNLIGGDGGDDLDEEENGGHGGHGLRADGGFAFTSGSALRGGDGGRGGDAYGSFGYPGDGGDGGAGLRVMNGATALFLDVDFHPGSGGQGGFDFTGTTWDGGPGADGEPVDADAGTTVDRYAAPARTCEVTSPVREGQTYQVTVTGKPFDAVVLIAAPAVDPVFRARLHGTDVPGAPSRILVSGAIVPHSGELTFTFPVPAIPADALPAVFQALHYEASGRATLSSPSRLVILDASF